MAIHFKRIIEDIGSDLRFASRGFRRTPGLTAVMLLSLALGIGANTAVFSMVDAVMFKLLPVSHPEQLYFLTDAPRDGAAAATITQVATPFFSYDEWKLIREQATSFSGMAAFNSASNVGLVYQGPAEVVDAQVVSPDFFTLLGVSAVQGRAFDESDDQTPGASPIAVVSYQYWKSQLGGNASVAGQPIKINDAPFTIIGVAPPGFYGVEPGTAPDVWAPVSMKDQVAIARERGRTEIVGRLRPGVEARQALAELSVIFDQILQSRLSAAGTGTLDPNDRAEILGRKIELTPGGKGLRGLHERLGDPLLLMVVIAGLVLLIACANVATLMMVKAGGRRREFAVRVSVGATRGRLIRQMVTESFLLTALAGLVGVLLQKWAVEFLLQLLASGSNPVKLSANIDIRFVIYAAAIMGTAMLLFGLFPALRATRVDLASALKENSSGSVGPASRLGGGRTLVAIQVSLSILLLIAAGLFIRTLSNIRSLETGLKADGVLMATVDPSLAGYKGARAIEFYKAAIERTERIPGVRSCSVSAFAPLGQVRGITRVEIPGYANAAGDDLVVDFNRVGPGYFETMGITLLEGRAFSKSDDANAAKVAVINESAANKYYAGQDPVGKTLGLFLLGGVVRAQICGIVKDSKYSKLREASEPTIYTPFAQAAGAGRMTLEVRTVGDPLKLAAAVRGAVAELGPDVPVFGMKTIQQQIDESLVQERLTASLSGFFGVLALALACIGLFGTTAHEVSRRTNEIGVRMALGAAPATVQWSVMKPVLAVVSAGIVIGLSVAILAAPLASKLLFGLTARDPVTFAAAAAAMILAAALAGLIPARRAARINPTDAMRSQ